MNPNPSGSQESERLADLRAKAESGDAEAQNKLGEELYHGSCGLTNEVEAVKWYRKAAEQNNADAQYNLGRCYARGRGVAKDETEALKWHRKALPDLWIQAEGGSAEAQNKLGKNLFYGNVTCGIENRAEAVKWYRKAAEQNNADAQCTLGWCYAEGEGVAKDEVEAVKWYRKAALQNYVQAQRCLSQCYAQGRGVTKDEAEAAKWWGKATERFTVLRDQAIAGDAKAQIALGWAFCLGKLRMVKNETEDSVDAVKWWRKAAEQSVAEAEYLLGWCYLDGRGVPRDDKEAVKWLQKAAEKDDHEAQNRLGDCYYFGRGVETDFSEAAKWWFKAAEQNNQRAQNDLGRWCYATGRGVVKDHVEAYKWISLSDGAGSEVGNSMDLDILEQDMTPDQILEAKQRADDWRKQHGIELD